MLDTYIVTAMLQKYIFKRYTLWRFSFYIRILRLIIFMVLSPFRDLFFFSWRLYIRNKLYSFSLQNRAIQRFLHCLVCNIYAGSEGITIVVCVLPSSRPWLRDLMFLVVKRLSSICPMPSAMMAVDGCKTGHLLVACHIRATMFCMGWKFVFRNWIIW